MNGKIIEAVRSSAVSLKNCIIRSLVLDRVARLVTVNLVSDCAYIEADKICAEKALAEYVPSYFKCKIEISKLSPDCEMVRRKIAECLSNDFKAVYATLENGDIAVEKTEDGFDFTIAVMPYMLSNTRICSAVTAFLMKNFCGNFAGRCVSSKKSAEDIVIEERPDEIEFEVPMRTFEITDFSYLEGTRKQESAIYLADLNFAAEEVVICGRIEDIRERKYTNKNGGEKNYLSLTISDTTATAYVTYFIRKKSYDRIKTLKVGDYIVCTGKNEEFRGSLRYTANIIDYGAPPKNFVPEKRESKPVPKFYHFVSPEQFSDVEQTDFIRESSLPECLKNNTFVVFDLETTGLNSSPVSGNMDRIIEIGAYKIENGEICQSFSTFVNPQRKLSAEIINLTGITEQMVAPAPTYEQVMPDFYKFCEGSILVGHNIIGFDFKFVDYYCTKLGYILERKLIDTISLSQELLFLSNYKLNTVADKFNISFNHHRATDDALATAKIFIELIKMKKSLPLFQ